MKFICLILLFVLLAVSAPSFAASCCTDSKDISCDSGNQDDSKLSGLQCDHCISHFQQALFPSSATILMTSIELKLSTLLKEIPLSDQQYPLLDPPLYS